MMPKLIRNVREQPKPVSDVPGPTTTAAAGLAREDQLAVNLFDVGRIDKTIAQMLLSGKLELDRSKVIRVDKDRMDETGVVFSCKLLDAACICDILRDHDRKAGEYPTRVYVRKKGCAKFVRLTHDAVLTEVVNGKPVLRLRWFSKPTASAEVGGKPAERIQF